MNTPLLSPEAQDFINAMVVDHLDGVVAEVLMEEHFPEVA